MFLFNYNFQVIFLGTMMLGIASGLVGTFMLLRRRALLGDALSHSTLPGVCIAYAVALGLGMDGKSLPILLLGAAASGWLGVLCVGWLAEHTRLKEDAALGIVLSVFYAIGVMAMKMVAQLPGAGSAGLETFIFGKTASMVRSDVHLIGSSAIVATLLCIVLFKEFRLLCFDADYARGIGLPVRWIDGLMTMLVVLVCVVGLQAVGLIMVIALLVIPPASARFWTDRLTPTLMIAAMVGGASAIVGTVLSARYASLPSGPTIVVSASALFLMSLIFGWRRGLIARSIRRIQLSQRVQHQHLMRAIFEVIEAKHPSILDASPPNIDLHFQTDEILPKRSWSRPQLMRLLRRSVKGELVLSTRDGWLLTDAGLDEARRVTRNHRLWEIYLLTHAEIAPSHVDRGADEVEHVLGPQLTRKLARMLEARAQPIPPSPHALEGGP